jgi:hypothetical protein
MEYGNQPNNEYQGGVWPPPPAGAPPPQSYLPNFQSLTSQSRAAVYTIWTSTIVANLSDMVDIVSPGSISSSVASLNSWIGLAASIVYLVWLYRAYKGTISLASAQPQTSPGWAVAYYFIPILAFYKPLQIVQEMYRLSDPNPAVSSTGKAPGLYLRWWLCYIVSELTGIAESIASDHSTKVVLIVTAIPDILLTTIATVLVCRVINDLTSRLHARYEAIVAAVNGAGHVQS